MRHWLKFRKDRFYLVKYLSIQLILALAVVSFQVSLGIDHILNPKLTLEWWHLILIPFGLIVGVKAPVLIHNCVHGNLRPKLMNQIAGEIAGLYVLLSMAAFELNHVMHHAHADTNLDPHNPHKRNFIGFFFANNFGGTDVVLHKFLKFHGDTKQNRLIFNLICVLHFVNVPVRLAFWILLLGPTLFLVGFVPSYLFHMFVFAHINYVTHETKDSGEVVLYNLDSNIYYRFVNFFGSGVYYHKNHHINPNVYNPKLGASSNWLFR